MKIANKEIFQMHAEVCRTLANPVRLMILALLSKREMRVGEIVEILGLNVANISQHLASLRAKNIVKARKEGQMVIYSLVDKRLIEACNMVRFLLMEEMKQLGTIDKDFDLSNLIIGE